MSFVQYYSVSDPSATDFAQIGYGQLQSIELTGNPQNVFDLAYISGTVGSISGTCTLSDYSTFDQANAQLTSVYQNYTEFIEDPVCFAAVFPQSFGYVGRLDDNTYTMRLDVRSFSTAMAVNYGVLPMSTLKVVDYNVKSFLHGGVNYTLGQYYDVRYRLMDTITCMVNASVIPPHSEGHLYQRLCFYVVGETFALPVFNHYGADPTAPVYCDCEQPVGSSLDCQEFNLLSGLVFYRYAGNATKIVLGALNSDLKAFGLFNLLDLAAKYPNYRSFNRAAYNASYITSASAFVPTTADLESAYSFCRINVNQTCSLQMFNSFQATSYEVSDYKYQVFNGSCKNSTSIPTLSWDFLVSNPPVAFTQTYYECFDSPRSSFVNAIGIASGNVQIFIPFVIFALLPFLYGLLVLVRQVPPKPEYSNEEQEQALRIFSMLLLRLRDGKTRGIKPRGVLMGLTKGMGNLFEIISAAKEEGGYPDSDDEDEEDESSRQSSPGGAHKHRSSGSHRPIRKLRSSSLNSADSSMVESESGATSEYTEYNRRSTANGGWGPRKSSITQRSGHSGNTIQQATHQQGRTKMGVFTKHIVERNNKLAQQQRLMSTDEGNNQTGRQVSMVNYLNPFASRMSSVSVADRSPYAAGGSNAIRNTISKSPIGGSSNNLHQLEAGSKPALNDDTYLSTNSTAAIAAPSNGSNARRRSTLMGYIFGGDEPQPADERASELVAHRSLPVYIDLNVETVPHGVRVMNQPDEFFVGAVGGNNARRQTMRKPLQGQEVDLLVDDLLRLFGESLAALARTSSVSSMHSNPMHSNGKSSNLTSDADQEGASQDKRTESVLRLSNGEEETTRDSFSFVQGKTLSVKLAQILFEELIAREDKTVFLKLNNALCMQASIELRCEMRHVMQKFGDRIAYNIGGRLMTASHLDTIL
eukprot:gene21988-28075_t